MSTLEIIGAIATTCFLLMCVAVVTGFIEVDYHDKDDQ